MRPIKLASTYRTVIMNTIFHTGKTKSRPIPVLGRQDCNEEGNDEDAGLYRGEEQ